MLLAEYPRMLRARVKITSHFKGRIIPFGCVAKARNMLALNDCEMQHNAEVGLFTRPSLLFNNILTDPVAVFFLYFDQEFADLYLFIFLGNSLDFIEDKP